MKWTFAERSMNWSAVICQENSTTFQSLLWETSCPNTLESALQSEPESADLTASDDLCLLRSLNVHLTFLKSSATMATEFCRKLCQAHALHRHGTKTYYKHPKFNASGIWALASQVILTLLLNEFKLHSHWRQHLKVSLCVGWHGSFLKFEAEMANLRRSLAPEKASTEWNPPNRHSKTRSDLEWRFEYGIQSESSIKHNQTPYSKLNASKQPSTAKSCKQDHQQTPKVYNARVDNDNW